MTKLTAPPSFEKFGDYFNDIEDRHADLQVLLARGLNALTESEKIELEQFLIYCITSEHTEADLDVIWMRTGQFLAFSPMRVFFRLILDELGRHPK